MKDRALRKAQKSPSGSLSEGDAVRFSYLPAAGASASPRDVAYHDDEEPGFAILILPLSEADPPPIFSGPSSGNTSGFIT